MLLVTYVIHWLEEVLWEVGPGALDDLPPGQQPAPPIRVVGDPRELYLA